MLRGWIPLTLFLSALSLAGAGVSQVKKPIPQIIQKNCVECHAGGKFALDFSNPQTLKGPPRSPNSTERTLAEEVLKRTDPNHSKELPINVRMPQAKPALDEDGFREIQGFIDENGL